MRSSRIAADATTRAHHKASRQICHLTETAAVALQIDLFEELRQALLDTPDISHNTAHSRSALIPTELWNFPYLAIHAPGHTPWLIHFEYINNKPHIAAISLDQ